MSAVRVNETLSTYTEKQEEKKKREKRESDAK
jgi:hypothetical protein